MNTKRLLLKLSTLILTLVALRSFAYTEPPYCHDFAILCTTDTSNGECGEFYTGQDCRTCYGDDGSTVPFAPECTQG
jgi:hypothetical protein